MHKMLIDCDIRNIMMLGTDHLTFRVLLCFPAGDICFHTKQKSEFLVIICNFSSNLHIYKLLVVNCRVRLFIFVSLKSRYFYIKFGNGNFKNVHPLYKLNGRSYIE
jgi:hypothetical protein